MRLTAQASLMLDEVIRCEMHSKLGFHFAFEVGADLLVLRRDQFASSTAREPVTGDDGKFVALTNVLKSR